MEKKVHAIGYIENDFKEKFKFIEGDESNDS